MNFIPGGEPFGPCGCLGHKSRSKMASQSMPAPRAALFRRSRRHARSSPVRARASHAMGLLLECDGVMVDVHRDAHRVAFNQAFQSMGLDCAHWSPQVYHDVMRGGKGSGEGMIIAYFNTVGWPLMVTEKDRVGYAQELHRMKRAAMKEMVENDQVEFRDGVLEFLDDALSAGAKVGLVAGTASAPDEHVVDMVMRKLGSDRASKISVFEGFSNGEGVEEDEQTKDSEEVLEDVASSLVAAAAEKQRKLKRNIARQASEGRGWSVDPNLLFEGEGISSDWINAVAQLQLGAELSRCVFVGAHFRPLKAAAGSGLLTAVVPCSNNMNGAQPGVDWKFDGFGPGGGLAYDRLAKMVEARNKTV